METCEYWNRWTVIMLVVFCAFFSQAWARLNKPLSIEQPQHRENHICIWWQMRLTSRCPYPSTTVADKICCLPMNWPWVLGKLIHFCSLYASGILNKIEVQWLYQKCRDWIVETTVWYPGTIGTENVKQLESVFQVALLLWYTQVTREQLQ